jgi:hypothetical protein
MPDTAPTKPVQTPEDPPTPPDEKSGKTIEVEADPHRWVYPEGMEFSADSYPDFPGEDHGDAEPKSATSGSKKASGGVASPDLQKKAESAAKAERKP